MKTEHTNKYVNTLIQKKQNTPRNETRILAYRIGISAIFTHVRKFYLTPLARAVPALGKDKKRTDARSAELLLPELLLVVNVNNIRFLDISAIKRTNKQKLYD